MANNPVEEAYQAASHRVREFIKELKTRRGMDHKIVSNLRPPLKGEPAIELTVADLQLLLEVADRFSIGTLDEMVERYQKRAQAQIQVMNRLQKRLEDANAIANDRSIESWERVEKIKEILK